MWNGSFGFVLLWGSRPRREGRDVMSDGAAPVIDAHYLMTRRSSLSGNVEGPFIPAGMPEPCAFEQRAGDAQQ